MTIKDRIKDLCKRNVWDIGEADSPASVDKMIILAYWIGKEVATRKVSDDYRALIAEMRDRAAGVRYNKLCNYVIGDKDYIYQPDYAGDVLSTFGGDLADL